jgi:hypothetical protein
VSTPTAPSAAPGWYADPYVPGSVRYFDGTAWTGHVAPAPGTTASPPPSLGAAPSDPVHWLVPTGRSWQSIAAGYLALLATVAWFLGPVALGLGIWALRIAGRTRTHGRGRAVFAVVVGALSTLALLLLVASGGLG